MNYADALDAVAADIARRANARARQGFTDAWYNLGTYAAASTLAVVYAESEDLTFEVLVDKINDLKVVG